jgi:hypothetical protein
MIIDSRGGGEGSVSDLRRGNGRPPVKRTYGGTILRIPRRMIVHSADGEIFFRVNDGGGSMETGTARCMAGRHHSGQTKGQGEGEARLKHYYAT